MSKNVTSKYDRMISAFSEDFQLALMNEHKLTELQKHIENKNEKLMNDISLLDELAWGLRNGRIIIREFPVIVHTKEKQNE